MREDVLIIAGSKSDEKIVKKVEEVLRKNSASYKIEYCSAHRDPERLRELIRETKAKVFICIAGLSAALPGLVASYTKKPVIGVPVAVKLSGLDSLLSIAQLPKGVPVGCVGIDNGENAALLALRILNLSQ